jgi:uncharacterized repeat protein (TIGR03803 family)
MHRILAIVTCSFLALSFAGCSGGSGAGITPVAGVRSALAGVGTPAAAKAGYKQLYVFTGTPDGASPYSGLVAINNTLYGTTLNGSKNYCSGSCGSNDCYLGCGTVFTMDTKGHEDVLYNFDGNFNNAGDGSWPFDGLTDVDGTLYGTTSGGGKNAIGTVFSISPGGTETVLYSFAGGSDAASPEAGLTLLNGKLYGATLYGGGTGCGGAGCGTVFEITTTGQERVVYSFKGGSDAERAYSGVTALGGKLYGATLFGGGSGCGGNGCGAVYVTSIAGKEKVLHSFGGTVDGGYPNGLTAVGNTLYGTTEGGGTRSSGTIFSTSASGSFKTQYNFLDIPDGNLPNATMIAIGKTLYGTTVGGGTAGQGTVFKFATSGNAKGKETVLYSFVGGTDGQDPQGPVVALGKKLYGTTTQGGNTGCGGSGCGTVYEVAR